MIKKIGLMVMLIAGLCFPEAPVFNYPDTILGIVGSAISPVTPSSSGGEVLKWSIAPSQPICEMRDSCPIKFVYNWNGSDTLPTLKYTGVVDTAAAWGGGTSDDSGYFYWYYSSLHRPSESPSVWSAVFTRTKDFVTFDTLQTVFRSSTGGCFGASAVEFYREGTARKLIFFIQEPFGAPQHVWYRRYSCDSLKFIDPDTIRICQGVSCPGPAYQLSNSYLGCVTYHANVAPACQIIFWHSSDYASTWSGDTIYRSDDYTDAQEPQYIQLKNQSHTAYTDSILVLCRSPKYKKIVKFIGKNYGVGAESWSSLIVDSSVVLNGNKTAPIMLTRSLNGDTIYGGCGSGSAMLIVSTDEGRTFKGYETHNTLKAVNMYYATYSQFVDIGDSVLHLIGCSNNSGLSRMRYATYVIDKYKSIVWGDPVPGGTIYKRTLNSYTDADPQWYATIDTIVNGFVDPISLSFELKKGSSARLFLGFMTSIPRVSQISPAACRGYLFGITDSTWMGFLFLNHGYNSDGAFAMNNKNNALALDTFSPSYITGWNKYRMHWQRDSVNFYRNDTLLWNKTDSIPNRDMVFFIERIYLAPNDSIRSLRIENIPTSGIKFPRTISFDRSSGVISGAPAEALNQRYVVRGYNVDGTYNDTVDIIMETGGGSTGVIVGFVLALGFGMWGFFRRKR